MTRTSKRFYKVIIDDIQHHHCTHAEIERLLDIFELIVQKMTTTLAHYAEFRLANFATAKQYGLKGFILKLEKCYLHNQEQWYGTFERGSKKLTIISSLEAPV